MQDAGSSWQKWLKNNQKAKQNKKLQTKPFFLFCHTERKLLAKQYYTIISICSSAEDPAMLLSDIKVLETYPTSWIGEPQTQCVYLLEWAEIQEEILCILKRLFKWII